MFILFLTEMIQLFLSADEKLKKDDAITTPRTQR